MKFGVAIFPSKEVQDLANSYRKRYDPAYAYIPPHITIKERFDFEEKDLDILVSELNQIANDTKPFPLIINKVSSFYPVTNTIYLKVEPVEELMALNEKMYTGNLKQERKYAFVPHITIGQELSSAEHSDIYGRLTLDSFDIKETIDRFQLLFQLENGTWVVHETFKFGKRS
jgi:2'-5' RNA ligase